MNKDLKHIFLFLIFCLSSNFLTAQKANQNFPKKFGSDTILWNANASLKFSDFKSKPFGSFQGNTFAGIILDFKQDEKGIQLFTYTLFFCRHSFIKDSSENLLKHEQLHFDITELFARKLRQQILLKHFKNGKSMSADINKIYTDVTSDLNKEQDIYDKETVHGTNLVKQQEWINSIHGQLKQLENYSEVEIEID